MVALNSSLAEIDWQALFDHCNTENDDLNENNEFAELLRLTVLQLCNIHCPKTAPIVAKTSTNRNISVLHRKRRQTKTRLHCLQNHQPYSSTIPYLQEQLSLLQLSIRDSITEELSKREQKAVETIKSNPRYFYSYAKRFSKLRSNVGPLKDENGSLQHQPKTMADILQTQHCYIFSDPNSSLIEQTLVGINQGDPRSIQDIDFDKEDIIKAVDELDTYAATSHDDIPAKIFKYCKHSISTPLTLLWKWSMETALIPSHLQTQFVAPIYKKGDKTYPAY